MEREQADIRNLASEVNPRFYEWLVPIVGGILYHRRLGHVLRDCEDTNIIREYNENNFAMGNLHGLEAFAIGIALYTLLKK